MKTVKQLAAELGVSKSTLHRLIQKLNQDCVIETVQRDNKILIDDAAEKAIIQAFNEKSSHGDASCTDAETAQKRVKSESCTDFETKYIESLEQQILDLKADKQYLQERLTAAEQERASLTQERDKLTQERQTILAELLELKQPKEIELKAPAEPTTAAATKRPAQRPRSERQQRQQKLSFFDRLFKRK